MVLWFGLLSVLSFAVPALAQTPFGHDSIRLLGVELRIDSQAAAHSDANSFQVPTGAAIELATSLVAGGSVVDPIALGLDLPLTVKGTLSGQGLASPVELAAVDVGKPLVVSPLTQAGSYALSELRLVDGHGQVVLAATPSLLRIQALDEIFVTSVSSRPLSLDEIRERGIILGSENYSGFEFVFGVATESGTVPINFPVVFPKQEADGRGAAVLPLTFPGQCRPGRLCQCEDGFGEIEEVGKTLGDDLLDDL